MTNAAGYCQDTAQYIEGMRQRVEQIKTGLTTEGWKGGASEKFAAALTVWDTEFKGVIQVLEDVYDRLNMGAGVYRNAADQNMDIAGGFAGAGEVGGRIDSLINANHR
ncbi:WXG100 family type VII secretion target [Nonomuraea sp. 3N208]|uniref:WXG100 family type VII secretion target n=1 Tax=Nonomuraea sp. 3N208 TaxID=3457421 RepID=UPI003FCC78FE